MKKFLFFAAALLGLVACNNKGNEPIKPGQPITLTATVDFGQGSNAPVRMVAPNTPISTTVGATVNFHWEAGDQVMLASIDGTEMQLFTIDDNSIQGDSATFTGIALSDMEIYYVFYAGKNISKSLVSGIRDGDPLELTNTTNNYNIFARGEGDESGFTLDMFYNALRLSLTGDDITLGAIKCYLVEDLDEYQKEDPEEEEEEEEDTSEQLCTTINFGTSGLALTNTPQEVWIPYEYTQDYIIFRFYDTAGKLIMEEKSKTMSWVGIDTYNNLIIFPTWEVKAPDPYLHMTPSAFRSIFLAADSASMEDSLKSVGFDKREISTDGYVYYIGESGKSDFNDAKIYSERTVAYTGVVTRYTCIVKTGEGKERLKLYADAFGGDPVVFGSNSLPYLKAPSSYPAKDTWETYKAALDTCVVTNEKPIQCFWGSFNPTKFGLFSVAIEKIDDAKESLTIFISRYN